MILGLAMCVCLLLAVLFTKRTQRQAEAANSNVITFDASSDFRVLEIVPYHGMGEIGYLVGGEEPIDLDGVELNKNHSTNYGKITSLLNGIVEWDKYYHVKTKLDAGERAEDYNIGTESIDSYPADSGTHSKITGSGYYERVEDGEGLYKLSDRYQIVEGKLGAFVADVDYFEYNWGNNGNYALKFTYETTTDWDGVSVIDSWGRYQINSNLTGDVTDQTGDYSKVFQYQTGNTTYQDKSVKFTYAPKTSDSDTTIRYKAVEITDTSSFGNAKYYVINSEGNYEFVEDGNGTHCVSFVPDAEGDYLATVIGGADYSNEKKQLMYRVDYRYTPGSGDSYVTFQRITDQNYTGTVYYVRSDYEIKIGSSQYNVICKKTADGKDSYLPSENGDYIPSFVAVQYADRTGADYAWVDCEKAAYVKSDKEMGEIGYTIYLENHTRDLIYYYRGSYINLETFKRKVLRLKESEIKNYKVDVLTVTPDELNANPHLVKQANFYYIIPTTNNMAYVQIYEEFGRTKDLEAIQYKNNQDKLPNFYYKYTDSSFTAKESNDLSWEVVSQIFYQIAVEDTALYINGTVYSDYSGYWVSNVPKPYDSGTSSGTSNNVAKLYLMLMQRDPKAFYHLFLSEDSTEAYKINEDGYTVSDENTGFTKDTGYFNAPNSKLKTAVYWNAWTFLPEVPNGTGDPAAYYASQGIDNPWITSGGALNSIRHTVCSFVHGRPMNGDLDQLMWSDKELLEYVKERDGLDTAPSSVSGFDMLNYIINKGSSKETIYKTSLTVLDLEPAKDQTLTVADVARWCNYRISESNITIIPMTMAEFIGKTETLSETYDLIYMGLGTAMMNKDTSGKTVYNDTSLNGKIYLHIGDLIQGLPKLSGMLSTDYITKAGLGTYLKGESYYEAFGSSEVAGNYRYSGNDLTKLKMKELKEYIDQGYPVIVADDFYRSSGDSTAINTAYIDNSSYVYELLHQNKPTQKQNVVKRSSVTTSIMTRLLNQQKLTFVKTGDSQFGTWPVEYEYEIDSGSDPVYLEKENGAYYLKFQFKFTHMKELADSNTKYQVSLYVDYNGDGSYSNSEKQSIATVTQAGREVASSGGTYQLEANTEYRLIYQVRDGYTGIVPYKLVITQTGNEKVSCSYAGYTAIENSNRKTLKVLQIISDDYVRGSREQAETYLDLSVVSQDRSTLLYPYLQNLNDYQFDFVTITVDEFIHLYELNVSAYNIYWNSSSHSKIKDKLIYKPNPVSGSSAMFEKFDGTDATSRLIGYDMIILGFGHEFTDINTEQGIQDILYYVKSGRSLLFTHDTTSSVNAPSDQFALIQKDSNDVEAFPSGTKYWGYQMNRYLRNIVGMDRYGVTISNDTTATKKEKNALLAAKDQAYKAGSEKTSLVSEIQGYTYHTLNSNAYDVWYSQKRNLNVLTNSTVDGTANRVTQVNEGRITEYPYQISEEFQISSTHGQYYQLDLEQDQDGDGQSDVVVWYCLSDNADGNGTYSSSPNDVVNNYYIYSVGNMTYSGVGHSKLTSKEEAKLFVNTLVAAYREVKDDTTLHVKNATKIAADDYFSYLDTDISKTYTNYDGISPTDERYYKKIAFELTSTSESQISVSVSDAMDRSYRIYNKEGNVVTGKVNVGEEYYIYVPYSVINAANTCQLNIKYGNKVGKVTLLRRNLFNLS